LRVFLYCTRQVHSDFLITLYMATILKSNARREAPEMFWTVETLLTKMHCCAMRHLYPGRNYYYGRS